MSKSALPELPGKSGEAAVKQATHNLQVDLTGMPVTELLNLHARVEALLPATSLKDISLEKTLVLQLLASQELQRAVLEDDEATPTQKAQVLNALSSVISTLSNLQIKLHDAERMKDIEGVLIDTVNTHLTEEQARAFFVEYRRRLGEPAR